MAKVMEFEDLWHLAVTHAKSRNDMFYHSCCDVWTARSAINARKSHEKKIRWRELMACLKENGGEDKKTQLLAKMSEERWRLPVVMNEGCQQAMAAEKKKKMKKKEKEDSEVMESEGMEEEREETRGRPSQIGLSR